MNEEELFTALALLRQQQKAVTEATAAAQLAAQESRDLSASVSADLQELLKTVCRAAIDVREIQSDIVAKSTDAVRKTLAETANSVFQSARKEVEEATRSARSLAMQMHLAVTAVVLCGGIAAGWFASNVYYRHMEIHLDVPDLAKQIAVAQKELAAPAKQKPKPNR